MMSFTKMKIEINFKGAGVKWMFYDDKACNKYFGCFFFFVSLRTKHLLYIQIVVFDCHNFIYL